MKFFAIFILLIYILIPAEYWGMLKVLSYQNPEYYDTGISILKYLVGLSAGYITMGFYRSLE